MNKIFIFLVVILLLVTKAFATGPYTDNGNIVLDQGTNLMWQKQTADINNDGFITSSDRVARSTGLAWCEGLVLDGKSDWKLPNSTELYSIVDRSTSNPAIDPIFTCEASFYWTTSNFNDGGSSYPWLVDFTSGGLTYYSDSYNQYVRCVHEGDSSSFDLSVTFFGGGIGSVKFNPPNEDCFNNCTKSYTTGTEVTLTATAGAGSVFAGWTGGDCSGTSYCNVTMDQAYSVTATFVLTENDVEVTVTNLSGGDTYHHGDQVTIDWTTTNASPTDAMVISMKRNTASTMPSPDGGNWYRFTNNTPNDRQETVTIPQEILSAGDWRFYVHHVDSDVYGASAVISVADRVNSSRLYLEKIGTGTGEITSNPLGLSCLLSCQEKIAHFTTGEYVTLSATPIGDSIFESWQGCDNATGNQCTILVNDYKEVSAKFSSNEDATTTLDVLFGMLTYEQGRVISTPVGIDCKDNKGNCTAMFVPGTEVTLQVTASDGVVFDDWDQGFGASQCDAVSGSDCIITIPNKTYIKFHPSFSPIGKQNLHINLTGSGQGSVSSSTGGIDCSSDNPLTNCDEKIDLAEVVTLTATPLPGSGSVFKGWSGTGHDCYWSQDSTCDITMNMPHTVFAEFAGEDLGIEVRSDQEIFYDLASHINITIKNNNGIVPVSGVATVDITASTVGLSGTEANWQCGDIDGIGTCEKTGDSSFRITVEANKKITITGARRYGLDVNTGTVQATVSYPEDVKPENDTSKLVQHRDPGQLPGVSTDVLMNYYFTKGENPAPNILVLTHGWQAENPKECAGKKGKDRLKCFGEHLWSGKYDLDGQASGLIINNLDWYPSGDRVKPNMISEDIDIIQYVWEGAFTDSGISFEFDDGAEDYIRGRRNVFDAGKKLGELLLKDLGNTYSGKIHFVGHSLGTAVNAYAIRHFLDHNKQATIQMTILDHPNRVSRILGMTDEEEKRWGFDEHFFSNVLPEINDPLYKDKLFVDNYYARFYPGSLSNTKFGTAGVGSAISGRNVYNHLGTAGLKDPNDVGQKFLPKENTLLMYNDHSGVHQWYRWTMWPSKEKYFWGDDFVCTGTGTARGWIGEGVDGVPQDTSLHPCTSGFAFSILQDNPWASLSSVYNGLAAQSSSAANFDLVGGNETNDCRITKNPIKVICSKEILRISKMPATKIVAKSASIDTESAYALMDITISEDISFLSFDYKFLQTVADEDVFLLVDGIVVWSINAKTATLDEWTTSGRVPVSFTKGQHKFMVVFNNSATGSSFEIKNLGFYKTSNNDFPWPMFLPAITGKK